MFVYGWPRARIEGAKLECSKDPENLIRCLNFYNLTPVCCGLVLIESSHLRTNQYDKQLEYYVTVRETAQKKEKHTSEEIRPKVEQARHAIGTHTSVQVLW